MSDEDSFTLVHNKRKTHKRRPPASCTVPGKHSDYFFQPKRCSVPKLLSLVTQNAEVAELADQTERRLVSLLAPETDCRSIHLIVVYGIGNFMTCDTARKQLALIHALRQRIGPQIPTQVFDPVLQPQDYQILKQHLLMDPILENESCGRRVEDQGSGKVLFFMPHVEKRLYDNLLRANWRKGLLDRVLVLGNSFSNMTDSDPARILLSECPHVCHSLRLGLVQEQALVVRRELDWSLNDLSLHAFRCSDLTSDEMVVEC